MDDLKISETTEDGTEYPSLECSGEATNFVEIIVHDSGVGYARRALDVDEVRQLRDWLNEWIRRNTDADWPIRRNKVTG